jgi:DNA-binding response OmpR family regulator
MSAEVVSFIIDDDEVFGSLLTKMLNKLGVVTHYFSNPEETLESAASLKPEIIFLDFKMPKMNGDEFMIRFSERKLLGTSRVVFVTADENVKEEQGSYESLGIENVLIKPVSYDFLKSFIEDHKNVHKSDRKKIAIVDDEEINVKAIKRHLEQEGYECAYYNSGESFLSQYEQDLPDLILLDILMPMESGLEVLAKIRQKFEAIDLPVVLLTSLADSEDVVEGLELGANDYITKPANLDVLTARVSTQLSLCEGHTASMEKIELETLHTIIATYNHEINNPLAIAMASLRNELSSMSERDHERARNAILRISEIVRSIKKVSTKGASFTKYSNNRKILKVN